MSSRRCCCLSIQRSVGAVHLWSAVSWVVAVVELKQTNAGNRRPQLIDERIENVNRKSELISIGVPPTAPHRQRSYRWMSHIRVDGELAMRRWERKETGESEQCLPELNRLRNDCKVDEHEKRKRARRKGERAHTDTVVWIWTGWILSMEMDSGWGTCLSHSVDKVFLQCIIVVFYRGATL